jgi:hypothetical protein
MIRAIWLAVDRQRIAARQISIIAFDIHNLACRFGESSR